MPPEWNIYPLVGANDRAQQVVEADYDILAYPATFDPIYVRGPVVEVVQPSG